MYQYMYIKLSYLFIFKADLQWYNEWWKFGQKESPFEMSGLVMQIELFIFPDSETTMVQFPVSTNLPFSTIDGYCISWI